jgi:hypothetical protein
MEMRATSVPTPREANAVRIGSVDFPFVSLLDDEHCHAEMAAVTISQRDFLPATLFAESGDENLEPDLNDNWGDTHRGREWWYREAKIVEAIDQGICGALVSVARHVLKHERRDLYGDGNPVSHTVTLSEKDQRPTRAMTFFFASSKVSASRTIPSALRGRSRGLSDAFPHDTRGKPGEYALYSQQQLTDGRRVLKFGGEALDELTYYQLSGPRLEAPEQPFNSASSPEMFDWYSDVPRVLVKHWKRNPKSVLYGPVARLKPAILASMRTRAQALV